MKPRTHFPEFVGMIFAAAILLFVLCAGQGGGALIAAIGLGTAGVSGTVWARRRELRRSIA